MQAIREIRIVEQGQIVLDLPSTLWGQQVEVIVLPISAQDAPPFRKKSLRGCLQQYAQPNLISTESEAWAEAVRENHEPC